MSAVSNSEIRKVKASSDDPSAAEQPAHGGMGGMGMMMNMMDEEMTQQMTRMMENCNRMMERSLEEAPARED